MITQKKYLNLMAILVALITGVLFLPGLSHADVTVEGKTVEGKFDFGEVYVGTSSLVTLNISSSESDDKISILRLQDNRGFSISPEVSSYIGQPLPVDINIKYTPLLEGVDDESILVICTDKSGMETVTLSGTGTIATQEITIEGILLFFDNCVADDDGSLEGYVPDKSDKKRSADKTTKGNRSDKLAENRLNALRNMIETAGHLIDSGKIDEACGQLKAAYKKIKMDDLNTPESSSFFVKGTSASKLADDVQDLMGTLGCK